MSYDLQSSFNNSGTEVGPHCIQSSSIQFAFQAFKSSTWKPIKLTCALIITKKISWVINLLEKHKQKIIMGTNTTN